MKPPVSCILVTRDRPAFFRQALRCYSSQKYPAKQLIVVDDGATAVGDLCSGVPDVKYIRLTSPAPTGTKLNIGIGRHARTFCRNSTTTTSTRRDSSPRLCAACSARVAKTRSSRGAVFSCSSRATGSCTLPDTDGRLAARCASGVRSGRAVRSAISMARRTAGSSVTRNRTSSACAMRGSTCWCVTVRTRGAGSTGSAPPRTISGCVRPPAESVTSSVHKMLRSTRL